MRLVISSPAGRIWLKLRDFLTKVRKNLRNTVILSGLHVTVKSISDTQVRWNPWRRDSLMKWTQCRYHHIAARYAWLTMRVSWCLRSRTFYKDSGLFFVVLAGVFARNPDLNRSPVESIRNIIDCVADVLALHPLCKGGLTRDRAGCEQASWCWVRGSYHFDWVAGAVDGGEYSGAASLSQVCILNVNAYDSAIIMLLVARKWHSVSTPQLLRSCINAKRQSVLSDAGRNSTSRCI